MQFECCRPISVESPADGWDAFDTSGWRLANRLKAELGVAAKVEYRPVRGRVGSGEWPEAATVFPEQYRHVWAWPSPTYGRKLAPFEGTLSEF